ncbi:MAG: HAD family hydrolase [bacterium]
MFQAIIFDLDGTLLDTIDDLADSMNEVLCKKKFPTHSIDKYKLYVGDGVEKLIVKSLPEKFKENDSLIQACMHEFKEEYAKRWNKKTKPYEGIGEMLDKLFMKEIKVAILSNKPDEFTKLCVKKLLPGWDFAMVKGTAEDGIKKPDPRAGKSVAEQLQVRPADVLYIGDTNTDMLTAVNAGFYPIGVSWGFRSKKELIESGAKKIIDKPMQIIELLGAR